MARRRTTVSITLADLERLGVTPSQTPPPAAQTACSSRYVRGVYRLGGRPDAPPSRRRRWRAPPGRDVVVSHISAGRDCGASAGSARTAACTSSSPARTTAGCPDVVIHRSHRIDPVDVVDRPDGIRVTSPPRTVFDLAAIARRRAARVDHRAGAARRPRHDPHADRDRRPAAPARTQRLGPLRPRPPEPPGVAQAGRLGPRAPASNGPSSPPACLDRCASTRSACTNGERVPARLLLAGRARGARGRPRDVARRQARSDRRQASRPAAAPPRHPHDPRHRRRRPPPAAVGHRRTCGPSSAHLDVADVS